MKYTIPLHIFFHYTRIWKKISVGGLYTSLFCAIIPTLFPYFLPFWYPYILLHFQMFFITCIIATGHIPHTVHYISAFGRELGLQRSLKCLIAGAEAWGCITRDAVWPDSDHVSSISYSGRRQFQARAYARVKM